MAKAPRADKVKLLGVVRRKRAALMVSTALQATAMLVLSLPADAQPAPNARPTGGVVVAGSAAIGQTANTTTINQSTQRAAVNWQSFDVGSQQRVDFRQPSASAMTLNRVVGPDPSRIAGRIDANGQVVLVNQSGVTFYKGAQVNTNGLMVSAVGITNQNFMAGKMVFDQPGSPNARVENQGTITVREAGLAALVAPQVANSGVINAKLGHVVLAGAKTATLDLYGDGLLSLDVSNQVTQAPVGADGKPVTALVTNTGVIVADGGTVQLTARAADGVVQNLVDAGGRIRAATVGNKTGTVALERRWRLDRGRGAAFALPARAPGTAGGAVEVVTSGNVHRRVDGEDQRERQGRRRVDGGRHHAGARQGRADRHAAADRGERHYPAWRDDRGECERERQRRPGHRVGKQRDPDGWGDRREGWSGGRRRRRGRNIRQPAEHRRFRRRIGSRRPCGDAAARSYQPEYRHHVAGGHQHRRRVLGQHVALQRR